MSSLSLICNLQRMSSDIMVVLPTKVAYESIDTLIPIPVDEVHITGFETMCHVKSISYDNKSVHMLTD